MARKNPARPCAERDVPEIWRRDGKERSRTRLPSAQTASPGRAPRARHPLEVLRYCSNRANPYRATWLMRASLAVAQREYNGRRARWEFRSTTFTKPNGSVIVAAVAVTFHPARLKNLVCVLL